jgi:hypothetical protein
MSQGIQKDWPIKIKDGVNSVDMSVTDKIGRVNYNVRLDTEAARG